MFNNLDDIMFCKRIDTNDVLGENFKSQEFCL